MVFVLLRCTFKLCRQQFQLFTFYVIDHWFSRYR